MKGKGKEEKLVRKAAKALAKLQRYRDRHAPSAAEGAAIERTVLIAGWPREAADLLVRAGVSAQEAARLFSDALERPQ
jgi:hypothetical protein